MNFVVGVNLSPGQFSWATIVVGTNFVFPGKNIGEMSRVTVPGDGTVNFRSPGQLLTTLDTLLGRNCPGKCLGISCYFCSYDDTDFICSYEKLCVRYGMFLYIRLQYVLGVCPNMSWGTRPPCGTTPPIQQSCLPGQFTGPQTGAFSILFFQVLSS